MSLFSQLQTLDLYPKIYWKDRHVSNAIAGAGIGSGAKHFGWRHFTPSAAAHWADFPSQFQFSPQVILHDDRAIAEEMEMPKVKNLTFSPLHPHWSRQVDSALKVIAKGQLDKVVLARECTLQLEKPIDPWPIVAALEKKVENAYIFCLQPTPRSAFLGASPERLFYRSGSTLQTEALAGTRPIRQSPKNLMNDPKDRLEFHLVEQSIREALAPFVDNPLTFSPPMIRGATSVQHIYSRLTTQLRQGVTDSNLLDRLHPTGALAGYPKLEAMELLSQLETFDRGLYGAPIGRSNGQESEWIVGIRSCLLFESTARLYSGTGIVAGSNPDSEWDELDSKLGIYKGIFL